MSKRRRNTRTQHTAVAIGRSLGRVAAQVDALNAQRAAVAAEIEAVIREAKRMLADIGVDVKKGGKRIRRAAKQAGSGKRRLSPEGRARIIAAARKRWAEHRARKGQ
ncbi:MAG: hypothetical protein R2752_22025 [Vicinamibacterales bacterium]